MHRSVGYAIRGVLLFLVIWTGWLPLIGAVSMSHDPMLRQYAEASLHAELGMLDAKKSGHTHDEDTQELQFGHKHGHGPVDHTHDFSQMHALGRPVLLLTTQTWLHFGPLKVDAVPLPPPERPPRPMIVV